MFSVKTLQSVLADSNNLHESRSYNEGQCLLRLNLDLQLILIGMLQKLKCISTNCAVIDSQHCNFVF